MQKHNVDQSCRSMTLTLNRNPRVFIAPTCNTQKEDFPENEEKAYNRSE